MITFIKRYLQKYCRSLWFGIYTFILIVSIVFVVCFSYEGSSHGYRYELSIAILTISGVLLGFIFNAFLQLGDSNLTRYKGIIIKDKAEKITNLLFYKLSFSFATCIITILTSVLVFLNFERAIYLAMGFLMIEILSMFHVLSDLIFILRDTNS